MIMKLFSGKVKKASVLVRSRLPILDNSETDEIGWITIKHRYLKMNFVLVCEAFILYFV